MAKKIIRLTESELHNIVENSVKRILKEDVLGNNWHENNENSVLNNYEPFKDQQMDNGGNEHDWGIQGEEGFDPTEYDNDNIYQGENDEYINSRRNFFDRW